MNYNNFHNPYLNNMQSNNAYQNYNNLYNQPIANNIQPIQQVVPQVRFAYVNNFEDVKQYIVMPNDIAYLQDKNSNCLYIKKADQQGRYDIKAYELREINQSNNNEYVKTSDFNVLTQEVNNLSNLIQNFINGKENRPKMQNSNKGENK